MSRRTFLVTGATGDTGGATVEQMLARGHLVRALAHRQDDRAKWLQGLGAEVVFGDFLNLDDVRAALRGVAGAYFCYPIRPGIIKATAFFAQAAKEAGVECVVNMSQISAREDAKSHAAQDHWLAERVFDWSGLTVVHLRPTYFAEWLLYLAPMIRAGLLHASAPQSHWHTTTMICSMRLDGSTACMAIEGPPIRRFSEPTCAESCAQHYARAMWSSWTTFHRTKALKLLG